jgi:pyrroline-5-carboxylate reductase
MKVGFIGYGSMGSMLVNSFIEYGALKPEDIIVSTRTRSKLDKLKARWEGIAIAENNMEAAQKAKYLFICVKPLDVKNILTEIHSSLTQDTNIVYIAGSVKIGRVEEAACKKVTKIIPSLTSEVAAGITLICHGSGVEDEEADYIDSLFNKISIAKRISEDDLALSTELTSCMPGFIASMFREIADSAKRRNLTLLRDRNMSFQEIVGRVATKGGITEEGVKVLESKLPSVFDELFRVTLDKRKVVNRKVEDIFAGQAQQCRIDVEERGYV